MAEEATTTEAPVQETTEQEPVVEQPQEQPKGPRDERQARQSAVGRAREMAESWSKSNAAKDQPRDEKGNFAKAEETPAAEAEETPAEEQSEETATPEAEATEDTPTAETTQEEEAKEPADETPQRIRVDIPSDHPALQGIKGVDALEVSTPEQEQFVKAILNGSHTRRKEVEQRDAMLARERETNQELRRKIVSYEAGQAATEKYKQSADYESTVKEFRKIKQLETEGELPEGAASRYWQGQQENLRKIKAEEEDTRWSAVEEEQIKEAAEAWTNDAWERNSAQIPDVIKQHPQINLTEIFQEEVQRFDRDIQGGYHRDVTNADEMHAKFAKILHQRIMNLDVVKDMVERGKQNGNTPEPEQEPAPQKTEDEIRAEERERVMKELAENRKANPTHPMGALSHAAEEGTTSVGRDEKRLPNNVGGMAAQKHAAASARKRASKWFGG